MQLNQQRKNQKLLKQNKSETANGKASINEKLFDQLYYNPKNPGSYSGQSAFKKLLREKNIKANSKEIDNWFRKQDTYTLHRPIRKKYKRNKIIVAGIDDTWQADLVDLRALSKYNNGFKFLLTIIDCFSKYAWAVPIKNKTNETIISSFKSIFKNRIPKRIHTDQGTEFIGKSTQKYFKEKGILFYYLNSEMKASIVERFNRTLKEKMWRYFTKTNKDKYIHIIDDLVKAYNNSYHRSIKMKPINVSNHNKDTVFFNLYGYKPKEISKDFHKIDITFNVGDNVRISKNKFVFDKGYTRNYTREIFKISQVLLRPIPVYKIVDNTRSEIKGVFYSQELLKVSK